MQGMERAYDYQELVGCANTVNQLAAIEYGSNGLQFGRAHNKQQNMWANLHPLEPGQSLQIWEIIAPMPQMRTLWRR
jgi:hypothetical protein